ncbi:MAG: undecaprenyl/decaprenyl-phosphate alpha-N-acetylglucosaminyl 1-phosphate transferase [Elusimicrobia bacterium]|nr:undecaprenyl/decaprenyl-phosphate alpha-N-acetylglucosaminyl 1-phosphate transferase [Elusimicrobiota bacterium]
MSFCAALAGAAFFTPVSIWLSERFGAMDQPDPRKIHSKPMPRWGGFGVFASALAAMFVLLWLEPRFGQLLSFRHKVLENGEIVGLLSLKQQFAGIWAGALVCLFLGMWDDRRPLSPFPKLLIQIIAAYVAMVYGVRMAGVALPGLGFVQFPIFLSQIVTLLWILGFMNAVNLVDGLDGLAAGIVAIAAGTFLVVCALQGETRVILYSKQLKLAAVLSAAVCGAAAGFLLYNFHPARVFMGDSGALFMGFMLGAISIIGTLKTSAVIALIIPVLVVALPVLDVAFALFRRFRAGQGLMQADRGHFHHRLLAQGWSQREIVLLVYCITLVLSLFTILLTIYKGRI